MAMERKDFHIKNRIHKLQHIKDPSRRDIFLPIIKDIEGVYLTEFVDEIKYSVVMFNDCDSLYRMSEKSYLDTTTYDEPVWIVFLINFSKNKLLLIDRDTGIIMSELNSRKTYYRVVKFILSKNLYNIKNSKRVKQYNG